MKAKLLCKSLWVAIGLALPLAAPLAPVWDGVAFAQSAQAQPKAGWYKNLVDTDFVKQHVEIPPRKDVTIIDARPAARQYDVAHIPGAINIPDSKFDQMRDQLPADKGKLVIVYCGGVECMLSHNVAHKMEKLGYTNIKVYADGNPAWSKAGLPMSVSTAYVKKLIDEKENFVLVDARPGRLFSKGHVPGAVSIPDSEFDKHVDKLPADKSASLVFYCGGLECNLSEKAAAKARKLGYTNIRVYAAGNPDWMAKGGHQSVSAAHIKKLQADKAPHLLIDARPKRTADKGMIPGAVNISETEFDKKVDMLPADKATPLIVYCGGLECVLSEKVAAKARALGYKDVKTYPEGYPGWSKAYPSATAGAETAAPAAAPAKQVADIVPGKEKGSISNASFEKLVREAPGAVLFVDVRDPNEYARGHLKGAINIPINELEKKLDTLPTDKPVIYLCATGARSGEAYDATSTLRGEVRSYFLDAEITFEADGSYQFKKKS